MVARRTPVFPCIELLKWLIDHTDTQKCLINDDNDECIGVFLPSEVQSYYNIRELEERLSTDFVVSFYETQHTLWWREDKKFTNKVMAYLMVVEGRQKISQTSIWVTLTTWLVSERGRNQPKGHLHKK
jgi:hypothetical protein